jgi:hypothetical protein
VVKMRMVLFGNVCAGALLAARTMMASNKGTANCRLCMHSSVTRNSYSFCKDRKFNGTRQSISGLAAAVNRGFPAEGHWRIVRIANRWV